MFSWLVALALGASPEPVALSAPKVPKAFAPLFVAGAKLTFTETFTDPEQPTKVATVTCVTSEPRVATLPEHGPAIGVVLTCTGGVATMTISVTYAAGGVWIDPNYDARFAPELGWVGEPHTFGFPLRASHDANHEGGTRVARTGNRWCRHDWSRTEFDIDERLCIDPRRGLVHWSYADYRGLHRLERGKRDVTR